MPSILHPQGTLITARFAIERVAGQGGMGIVYRARDLHTGNPVALKILHKGDGRKEAALRFLREAQALSTLQHPGIVAYITHGQTLDDQPFLVTEWLDGEDLAQRLNREGLSLSESLELIMRVAQALTVAHKQGIIHRDIKPSSSGRSIYRLMTSN